MNHGIATADNFIQNYCSLCVLQKHTPELIAKILKLRKQSWHTALPGSVLHLFLKAKRKKKNKKTFIYLFDARHGSVIARVTRFHALILVDIKRNFS